MKTETPSEARILAGWLMAVLNDKGRKDFAILSTLKVSSNAIEVHFISGARLVVKVEEKVDMI